MEKRTKPEFKFEAILSYSKTRYQKHELDTIFAFLRDYTLKINEDNLTCLKYGEAILN